MTLREILAKYDKMREPYYGCVLLFDNDGQYVSVCDDADVLAEVCGVSVEDDGTVRKAAVPSSEVGDYILKLVRSGHRCAVII